MSEQNNQPKSRSFRLSLVDDLTHRKLWVLHFTKPGFLVTVISAVVVLFAIVYALLAYTPLRTSIPGYPDAHTRRAAIQNAIRIDSLENVISRWELYSENLVRVIEGETPLPVDSVIRLADAAVAEGRDAAFLARMLAVGNVVEVAVPSPAVEAARDLARAREDCRHDLTRARHLLSKFLLRKGVVYGRTAWTKAHRAWLASLSFDDPCEQLVLDEYLEGVRSLELRRARLDAAIAGRASRPDLAPVVSALRCLRGISTVTAFTLAVEVGDFSRFPDARSFMSYVGLVPSESSSGETVSRGGITRTGNGHARTLLVESAWHHARRYTPMSPTAIAEAAGVPAAVAEAAARANRRLHGRCAHLRSRGKPANVVNAAVARELAGFVWALAVLAAR